MSQSTSTVALPVRSAFRTFDLRAALRKNGVAYALSFTLGLLVWQLVASQLPSVVFASPLDVFGHLVSATYSGELPRHFANSLRHMVSGLMLAVLVAVPLGMLMGRSETAYHMFNPVVTAIFAIPSVAFVPFLIIWFGVFFEARVALVFVMCVFDILITVTAGARNIEPKVIQVARSFGASRSMMVLSVILPASFPFLMTAIRIGAIRAVNGMITAELFFATVNLGEYMEDASALFDSAAMLSVVFLLATFGLLLQEVVKLAEAKLLPWHVRR